MAGDAVDPVERALAVAYRHLNRRDRTVAEVRAHLLARELEPDAVETAVEELIEQRVLDDERFAHLFVQDKRGLEQWGTERIRRGLAARGVERETAERALADSPDPDVTEETELDRAIALLRARFPKPPQGRDRDRALGVLLRKGYEYELALDALRSSPFHG